MWDSTLTSALTTNNNFYISTLPTHTHTHTHIYVMHIQCIELKQNEAANPINFNKYGKIKYAKIQLVATTKPTMNNQVSLIIHTKIQTQM